METLVNLAIKRKRDADMKTVSYDQNIFAMGGGVKGGIKK
jgi:D-alanine-D-alanine ligase